jgi:F-type H+-transporting ATPase subunit a
MDHHQTWFSILLPFYDSLESYFVGLQVGTVKQGVHHVVSALLVFLILICMSLYARIKLRNIDSVIVPSKRFSVLNFFELILQMLMTLMKDIIGNDYKRHVPLVGTFALFILISNLLGLVPGFVPPTDNLNTTFACGLIVFIYFNFQGFKSQGIGHITHLANPIGVWWGWFLAPLIFPIELIGLLVRPFSLAVRLAGNMIGDHKVILAFVGILPFVLPLPFMFLGLFVSLIQTTVFCILTSVYIALHAQEASH